MNPISKSTSQDITLLDLFAQSMELQQPWGYSKPIENSKQPGFSHIYRNSNAFEELQLTPVPGVTSLKKLYHDLFLNKYADRPFVGRIQVDTVLEEGKQVEKRSIQNILTYRQGYDVAIKLSSALLNEKLIQQEEQGLNLIGIYSRNRQQFYLADLAFILYGITTVPLYDTLGLDNLAYCLEHSNISTCICSASNAKTLLSINNTANLKNIVLCDTIDADLEQQLSSKFKVYYFWKLVDSIQPEHIIDQESIQVDPNQCFTFSYTSGTTGRPKAAMLSHKNFLSFVAGFKVNLHNLNRSGPNEVHLSILPMPHVYERIIVLYQISIGSFIIATSGNLLKLKDDIALVKPTQLVAVPRLYNRIVQSICDTFGGEEAVRKLIEENSPILEKISESFGGRLKFMMSGSAPINPKVIELFGKIMGVPMVEAYGQTQNTGGAFMQNLNDKQYGKIGAIWPNHEFKLADIPEMGYTSDDKDEQGRSTPRGEIWLRGNGVILGYYKQKELTAQTITEDGWLRTGDVGALTAEINTMKLIDRKKNIFKLSQGEYVSSEKVEFFYVKSKYITEAFLHGDSLQSFAVCIVVPNRLEIEKLGKELGLEKNYHQLCEDKVVIKHVLGEMIKLGHEGKLNGFQQAKNLRFQPESFAARGIVSSTMKLQRFEARNYYKDLIASMYSEGMLIQHAH